jgi:hypothetical protein
MSKRERKYDVAIYLRGDTLDPALVSAELGIAPSRSQRKGGPKSSNNEFLAKIGIWVLEAKTQSDNLAVLIEELGSKLNGRGPSLRSISGVDEVYLDVFASVLAEEDGGGSLEFELPQSALKMLAEIGVPARFTIVVVKK